MTDIGRIALAARVCTLAALTSVAALAGTEYVSASLLVVLGALAALGLSSTRRLSETTVAILEGAVVATVAALTYPDHATVIPYLVVPTLIAALDHGLQGLLRVVTVAFGLLAVLSAWRVEGWDRELAASGFTWLTTAIGIGVMGAALRRAGTRTDADASYRSAVGLIRRLEALSGKLSGGLDAVDIADQVMDEADTVVPTRSAQVFVRSPTGSMTALRQTAGIWPGPMAWAEPLADECWRREGMLMREQHVAIPLVADEEMIAVLVLDTLQPIEPSAALDLRKRLTRHAVQLQAALLFGRVRDNAMSQERHRIAREVHDGVAQDVASLGYLVDNLAATATEPRQQREIDHLRGEVTRVVTELRHSIFDLRHEVASGAGLGESLSAYANQVGATSPMTVHVTLDEEGPRLPGDVEHELLRIGKEAMANARKHSGAANLWLRCTVRSPRAEIEVGDDGTRRHRPSADSQGLKIMRERSLSIGAELVVEEPTPDCAGTRVLVRMGRPTG